jgi:hypothetical protein
MPILFCSKQNIVAQICFCILFIVLFLFKTHNVSETGFFLSFQVKPIQLGPIDRATRYLQTQATTQDRTYKPSAAQTICES